MNGDKEHTSPPKFLGHPIIEKLRSKQPTYDEPTRRKCFGFLFVSLVGRLVFAQIRHPNRSPFLMFTLLSMWSENIYILYTKVSIENIKLIEASKI